MSKNNNYQIAVDYLEQHYFSSGKLSGGYYEELKEILPKCLYSGEAYRVLFVNDFNDNISIQKKYSSWSSNLNGIKNFIENRLSDTDGSTLKNQKILILKSSVNGLDILKSIDVLIKNQYYPAYARNKWLENEIIAFEMSSPIEYDRYDNIQDFLNKI